LQTTAENTCFAYIGQQKAANVSGNNYFIDPNKRLMTKLRHPPCETLAKYGEGAIPKHDAINRSANSLSTWQLANVGHW